MPLTRPLSPDNYELLYDNVIAKIEDAGYSVGRNAGRRLIRIRCKEKILRSAYSISPVRPAIQTKASLRTTTTSIEKCSILMFGYKIP
jgi:hypothetical protein